MVIGGAGFIGSHLVDALVMRGDSVTVVDDFSVGRRAHLRQVAGRVEIVELQVSDATESLERLVRVAAGQEVLFHLAANPEARWGLQDTALDLRQNTVATWAALEAARRAGVGQFVLASSGTVYGDVAEAVAEDHGPLLPISLYGASKLACEALLSAFSHCFGVRGLIFRFGNVIGPRATHGAALDFIKKIEATPARLEVLGDGNQAKPYLHVSECVAGILFALDHAAEPLNVFNLAPESVTSVREIAETVAAAIPGREERATIVYGGGARGWPGDVPKSRLKADRLAALGYRVQMTSTEAVQRAIAEMVAERKDVA